MKHAKEMFISLGFFAILIVVFLGFTYAFFRAQGGSSTTNDVSVTSNTTDNLSFQISNDITFTVTQADLTQGGNNKGGDATATAILTPNNKTGSASMNYYMYLNLTENGIIYSSTNTSNLPELMVQVYDSNNQLVSLSGLGSQKTVKGVTGYDITGRLGLIPLLDNREIRASNNTSTTENWQVVVTMINLDVDQNDNTNKTVAGEIIVRKDQQLDNPRLAVTVPQESGGVTKGYVETTIEPSIVNGEELYLIYTVGYITDETIDGTEYSIDIENLGIDLGKYDLELVGTPLVMETQNDYVNYLDMKENGLPLTSLSNGDTNRIQATAQELYTYSLNNSELTIDDVQVSCNFSKCTARISEYFNNINGKSKHTTIDSNNEPISVLYNGIKFNLKKKNKPDIALQSGIYYHDETLEYSANDGSYRYYGADPNNYICFGSDAAVCPDTNIYRIIGLIPVDVVVDDTDQNNIITDKQMLYKIIKNDYPTAIELNTTSQGNASKYQNFTKPVGNQPSGTVDGFYWDSNNNTWSTSTINNALNSIAQNSYLSNMGSAWNSKIENVMWKVSGYYGTSFTAYRTYEREIIKPGTNMVVSPTDGKNEIPNKVGLMYVSDYMYAVPQSGWNRMGSSYYNNSDNNWLYKGVYEWFITRNPDYSRDVHYINGFGSVGTNVGVTSMCSIRPTFYLTQNTVIDMSNYTGTKSDPFRIL